MDDCVAAEAVAVGACIDAAIKETRTSISCHSYVPGLLNEEDVILSREH